MDFEKILTAMLTIALGIVGVAALTALVSSQSNSPAVIGGLWAGFSCSLKTAMTGRNECGSTGGIGGVVRGGGTTADSGVKTYGCPAGQFMDTDGICKDVPGRNNLF